MKDSSTLQKRFRRAEQRGLWMGVTKTPQNRVQALANFDGFITWLETRYGGHAKRSYPRTGPCHSRLYSGRYCPAGCVSRCDLSNKSHACLSRDIDHPGMWKVDGKHVALTSETYLWQVEEPDVREWAEAHGLDVHVFIYGSFWNPGSCHLLVFTAKQNGWLPVLTE